MRIPDDPLRAIRYHHRVIAKVPTPNWRLHLHRESVEVWEACALSLNLEPDAVRKGIHAWASGPDYSPEFKLWVFPTEATMDEFHVRLRLACSRIRAIAPGTTTPGRYPCHLSDFCRWAFGDMKWQGLPTALVHLASEGTELIVQHTPNHPPFADGSETGPANVRPVNKPTLEESAVAPITPAKRRSETDISRERGARRQILELWDEIERLHGPRADARQVLSRIKFHQMAGDAIPKLKTVQNHISKLRKEGLIP